MVKPKVSWEGLDREFCCPVTHAKLHNIVVWLTNPNIIWSLDMIIFIHISYIVSLCDGCAMQITSHIIQYTSLLPASLIDRQTTFILFD